MDLLYRIGRLLTRVFLPTFGSVEVLGRENVPPVGPVILAANHQSNLDPPMIVYAMPRPIWFMAKRGLFAGPLIAALLRSLHVFPVDRDQRDLDALRWAQTVLNADRVLLIFPEGTRSPGGLRKATDGVAYLALRAQVPILPVSIVGTEGVGSLLRIPFHFQRVRITFGEPFSLPPIQERPSREVLGSLTEQIMVRIAELLPPAYRGVYAFPLSDGESSQNTGLPRRPHGR